MTTAGSGGTGRREGRWVTWYAVAVLVLGAGVLAIVGGSTQSLVFALWMCAYAVAALGLLDDLFRSRRPFAVPLPLAGFVALAAASVLWTVSPELTNRRALGIAGTVTVGVFLAHRLRPIDLLDALRRAVLIIAVASLLLYLSGSPLALDEVHGTLRGILITKNTLGRMLAFGILAAVAVALLDRARRRRSAVSLLVMLGALALTGSTGGMLTAAAALGVLVPVALATQRRARAAVLGAGLFATATALVVAPRLSLTGVTGVVGEDATLTGRTEIWEASLRALADRPLLGYGYGAFWHEDLGAAASDHIRARLQWNVPNAHNGLLDIALDLGVVGAALAVALLVGVLVRGVRDVWQGRISAGSLRLAVLAATVASNLAETGLMQHNALPTIVLVAALALPDPRARGLQPRPAPGPA
ncbi:O-antigen ligase family protein [Kineococcus xinjiangensis]|nr:O-antigen ligase [Kineococcus xinjiangensis]